jgi:methylmalonyl-CoA/ethylmalonyl-CoA epimerase
MVIDHIGIAVSSLEAGIEHWKNVFGYTQLTEIIINTRQKVRVVFLTKSDSLTVKLIEPTDLSSPIHTFVQKGAGLHHLCFKCANIEGEIVRLKELGLRVLVSPQPGEAFENENIAFIFARQGLNIELIDTEKRAGLIPIV